MRSYESHRLCAAYRKFDVCIQGEITFKGDQLCEGGKLDSMHNSTHYREIRQFKTDFFLIRFYFVTRVFSDYFNTIVEDLQHPSSPKIDVVIMNSCVWDMTR